MGRGYGCSQPKLGGGHLRFYIPPQYFLASSLSRVEDLLQLHYPDIFDAMARKDTMQCCRLGPKEGLFSGLSINLDKSCHIHQVGEAFQ